MSEEDIRDLIDGLSRFHLKKMLAVLGDLREENLKITSSAPDAKQRMIMEGRSASTKGRLPEGKLFSAFVSHKKASTGLPCVTHPLLLYV